MANGIVLACVDVSLMRWSPNGRDQRAPGVNPVDGTAVRSNLLPCAMEGLAWSNILMMNFSSMTAAYGIKSKRIIAPRIRQLLSTEFPYETVVELRIPVFATVTGLASEVIGGFVVSEQTSFWKSRAP